MYIPWFVHCIGYVTNFYGSKQKCRDNNEKTGQNDDCSIPSILFSSHNQPS